MAKYLETSKRFFQIIKENGGIIGSLKTLYRTDELKTGTLVGTDKYGNKYFHNQMYFMGRSRWVEYADHVAMDYNASQVPPEWHGWLHYTTDKTPVESPPVMRAWMIDHEENQTATSGEYVPYSTAKPKIQSWSPPRS